MGEFAGIGVFVDDEQDPRAVFYSEVDAEIWAEENFSDWIVELRPVNATWRDI